MNRTCLEGDCCDAARRSSLADVSEIASGARISPLASERFDSWSATPATRNHAGKSLIKTFRCLRLGSLCLRGVRGRMNTRAMLNWIYVGLRIKVSVRVLWAHHLRTSCPNRLLWCKPATGVLRSLAKEDSHHQRVGSGFAGLCDGCRTVHIGRLSHRKTVMAYPPCC